MFDNLKLEPCPYAFERVRVRFRLAPEQAVKLHAIVEPYYVGPEFDDQLGGSLKGDGDVTVYYGLDVDGECAADELTVSLTYDDGEGRLDGTNTEIDFNRAWAQFMAPLRQIKATLEA